MAERSPAPSSAYALTAVRAGWRPREIAAILRGMRGKPSGHHLGRASTGRIVRCGDGVAWRKVLRRAAWHQAVHEFECAHAVRDAGITAPVPIALKPECERLAIDIALLRGAPLSEAPSRPLAKAVVALAERVAEVDARLLRRGWSENLQDYLRPIDAVLRRTDLAWELAAVRRGRSALVTSRDDVVVHGDFGPHNLAADATGLELFDFQTMSRGPHGWDLAYLCGCLDDGDPWLCEIAPGLDERVRSLAIAAAAVKLGRRMIRGVETGRALRRLVALHRRLELG